MKYVINFETLKNVADKVNSIAEAESTVELTLGAKDMGDKVLCGAVLTATHEQVMVQFAIAKPEGYEGKGEKICLKAGIFTGTVFNLVSLKSDIFIDIKDGVCLMGIEGKAQSPIQIIAEAPAAMKAGKALFNLSLKGSDFLAFLKAGLLCSSDDGGAAGGLNNSVIAVNTNTGEMTGISTDKYVVGYSAMTGTLIKGKKPEEEKAALDAYCTEKGVDPGEFTVLIPRKAVEHLKNLVGSYETFRLSIDDKHVTAYLGNDAIYMAVQGATLPVPVKQVKAMMAAETSAKCCVDNDELDKLVSFINGMNDLTASGKSGIRPVKLSINEGIIKAESGAAGELKSSVKAAAANGSSEANVNGKFLKNSLSYLRKGGVVLGFIDSRMTLITLANGNLSEGEDGKGKIAILCIRVADTAEESDDAEAEA